MSETGEAYDSEMDRVQQAEEHGREIPQTCPSCDGEVELGPWKDAYEGHGYQREPTSWWYRDCPKCQYQWAEWKLVRYGRKGHE
jgi:hypothetical protein